MVKPFRSNAVGIARLATMTKFWVWTGAYRRESTDPGRNKSIFIELVSEKSGISGSVLTFGWCFGGQVAPDDGDLIPDDAGPSCAHCLSV